MYARTICYSQLVSCIHMPFDYKQRSACLTAYPSEYTLFVTDMYMLHLHLQLKTRDGQPAHLSSPLHCQLGRLGQLCQLLQELLEHGSVSRFVCPAQPHDSVHLFWAVLWPYQPPTSFDEAHNVTHRLQYIGKGEGSEVCCRCICSTTDKHTHQLHYQHDTGSPSHAQTQGFLPDLTQFGVLQFSVCL